MSEPFDGRMPPEEVVRPSAARSTKSASARAGRFAVAAIVIVSLPALVVL